MEEKSKHRSLENMENPAKRPYATPKLNDFGSIETLSLGGAGTSSENSQNKSSMKHP
jgi:hypothetical protein